MEALKGVAEKQKKVRDYHEKLLETIVWIQNSLKKSKMDILTSIEKDVEEYETTAKLCRSSKDDAIQIAEGLISNMEAPQVVSVQAIPASSGQWEQ